MSGFRLPGTVCRTLGALRIDAGTLCRAASAAPGTVDPGAAQSSLASRAFVDPQFENITQSVGNGFCVPLIQLTTAVGHTSTWKAGASLAAVPHPELKAGTAIATFNQSGKYESKARGNHAAFFVQYSAREGQPGIVIYDQYREWPDRLQKEIKDLEHRELKLKATPREQDAAEIAEFRSKLDELRETLELQYPEMDDQARRFRRKQPGRRFIPFDGKGGASNDASAYSVIVH